MSTENCLEAVRIKDACFDELKQPCLVFDSSHLKGNGGKVFGRKDPCRTFADGHRDGLGQRFLNQRPGRRKKLNGPSIDHNVFALHAAATGTEVVENRLRTQKQRTGTHKKGYKDVNVKRRDRFKMKSGADRATNSVIRDYAISPHAVDGINDSGDAHGRRSL